MGHLEPSNMNLHAFLGLSDSIMYVVLLLTRSSMSFRLIVVIIVLQQLYNCTPVSQYRQ